MTLDDDLRRELLAVFEPNARERVNRLREGVVSLVAAHADRVPAELVGEAHTLQGSSATVGLHRVSALTAELESALEAARLESARNLIESIASELGDISSQIRTVLCIEDDPTNLLLVQRVAARTLGVRLLSARTGLEGLELVRREHPDLVIVDLGLPGLRGEDVLARLHSDPATAGIPVVVVSANAQPGRAKQLLEAGAAEYLTKPLDVDRLIELLESGPQ